MEKVFESEYRFLCILWENQPIKSSDLVKRCNEALGWKKSTTYTVIKKLISKEIVENKDTIVRALVEKEEVDRIQSNELYETRYKGNIPAFFAAFLQDKKLTKNDVTKIKKIIEESYEE